MTQLRYNDYLISSLFVASLVGLIAALECIHLGMSVHIIGKLASIMCHVSCVMCHVLSNHSVLANFDASSDSNPISISSSLHMVEPGVLEILDYLGLAESVINLGPRVTKLLILCKGQTLIDHE